MFDYIPLDENAPGNASIGQRVLVLGLRERYLGDNDPKVARATAEEFWRLDLKVSRNGQVHIEELGDKVGGRNSGVIVPAKVALYVADRLPFFPDLENLDRYNPFTRYYGIIGSWYMATKKSTGDLTTPLVIEDTLPLDIRDELMRELCRVQLEGGPLNSLLGMIRSTINNYFRNIDRGNINWDEVERHVKNIFVLSDPEQAVTKSLDMIVIS